MKVNIYGHGYVPGLDNVLAPAMGVEVDESFIQMFVHLSEWRIYDAESGLRITTENVKEVTSGGDSSVVTWEVLAADETTGESPTPEDEPDDTPSTTPNSPTDQGGEGYDTDELE